MLYRPTEGVILLLLFFGLSFTNCRSGEKQPSMILEGRLSVEGNEPFTALILNSPKGRYVVQEKQREHWQKYQNQEIRVKAKIVKKGSVGAFLNTSGVIEIISSE